MCYPILPSVHCMIRLAPIQILVALAKQVTKIHSSHKNQTGRNTKTSLAFLTRAEDGSKHTKKPPFVIRTDVSIPSTVILQLKTKTLIKVSVISMRKPRRSTHHNRSVWGVRKKCRKENSNITNACVSSKMIIGQDSSLKTTGNRDQVQASTIHSTRPLNSGWETNAWIRFHQLISLRGFCVFCWYTYHCCSYGRYSSGPQREIILRWTITSRWCYKRDSIG